MRKVVVCLLFLLFCCSLVFSIDIDFSSYSDKELQEIKVLLEQEINSRKNNTENKSVVYCKDGKHTPSSTGYNVCEVCGSIIDKGKPGFQLKTELPLTSYDYLFGVSTLTSFVIKNCEFNTYSGYNLEYTITGECSSNSSMWSLIIEDEEGYNIYDTYLIGGNGKFKKQDKTYLSNVNIEKGKVYTIRIKNYL